ncbi:MAG TPA: hypothetical protein VHM48_12175 [Candidatus Limnocylindrales bacterium]|nr:hypothetical protein [Candidatus Limnocylindrales bacterium]
MMKLFGSSRPRPGAAGAAPGRQATTAVPVREATDPVCLQCGMIAAGTDVSFCRRCGLPIGAAPRAEAELPSCPTCYATVDDDGLIASCRQRTSRIDLVAHMVEHEQYPVGDDDYLESLRSGDLIRIGRWQAPYDLVRRYLVTGAIDGGRRRSYQHSAIVTAMSQLKRWGPEAEIFGDQEEWRAARQAVGDLLERFNIRAASRA